MFYLILVVSQFDGNNFKNLVKLDNKESLMLILGMLLTQFLVKN